MAKAWLSDILPAFGLQIQDSRRNTEKQLKNLVLPNYEVLKFCRVYLKIAIFPQYEVNVFFYVEKCFSSIFHERISLHK